MGPGHLTGRDGGGPGGEAVVDDHGGAALERDGGRGRAYGAHPVGEFGSGSGLYTGGFFFGDPGCPHDLNRGNFHLSFAEGAETEFGLGGHPEFADKNYVEGRLQAACHFGRDGHTTAREAQHHGGCVAR